jgi:ligand-binding SRPBCC domain-containing protein
MEHILEAEIELPKPLEEVFAFFARAENLERITPPELGFRIVTPAPVVVREGALIDYRLSLFGVPFGWQTKITQYDPPHSFTDEQLKGPYKLWVHQHTFEPTPGGTVIRDRVRYQLPFYPFSEVAHPLVRRQLARIFAYRREAVIKALG